MARSTGAELLDFDKCKVRTFDIGGMKIGIAQPALEADLLVSVPKLKTHTFTKFTGAVKNLFGCLPGDVKSNVHRFAGGEPKFSDMLVDIYSTLTPGLAVMDAVWGMDGDGPTYGRTRKIGYVLASKNPVALDSIAARMAGFSSTEVHTIRICRERNLFPKNVETTGEPRVPSIPDFRRPATARTAPQSRILPSESSTT